MQINNTADKNKEYQNTNICFRTVLKNTGPNIRGYVYTPSLLKSIESQLENKSILAEYNIPDVKKATIIDLNNVCARISGVTYDDTNEQLIGEITVLNNVKGELLKDHISNEFPISFGVRGLIKTSSPTEIKEINILTFDVITEPENIWPKHE